MLAKIYFLIQIFVMLKKIVLVLCFSCSISFIYTLNFSKISLSNEINNFMFNLSPTMSFGTHSNGVGFNVILSKKIPIYLNQTVICPGIGIYSTPVAFITNFGIPDESLQINIGTDISFSWGQKVDSIKSSYFREYSTHSLRYYFNYYFSTNGTSQPYGGIQYCLSLQKNDLIFSLDNDDAYCIPTDKFRTTKGQITFLNYSQENKYGLKLGFLLWTGNLDGTLIENAGDMRDNSYELSGYGGEYSHGIVEMSFIFNEIELSIGYDSETVRDVIQNGWHNFYNRPRVPLVERDNRFYFQIQFSPPKYRY